MLYSIQLKVKLQWIRCKIWIRAAMNLKQMLYSNWIEMKLQWIRCKIWIRNCNEIEANAVFESGENENWRRFRANLKQVSMKIRSWFIRIRRKCCIHFGWKWNCCESAMNHCWITVNCCESEMNHSETHVNHSESLLNLQWNWKRISRGRETETKLRAIWSRVTVNQKRESGEIWNRGRKPMDMRSKY